jgi:hypothetical protein
MNKYFSSSVVVELLRTSSTVVFAMDLSATSAHGSHGSHGYSARGPYAVKVAFVVWRLALGSSAPGRDNAIVHVCPAER